MTKDMTKQLSIVFVRRGYSQSGGAEAYLKRLAHGVVIAGHAAQLVTTEEWPQNEWPFGAIRRLQAGSVTQFACDLEKIRPQLRCDVLMSLERVRSCDVYRAGDGVHRAWLARRRKFELPLERFVRGLNRKRRDILQLEEALLANRGAERVIVNSQMVKTEIVDFYGYPADKIDIVRNGVPMGQFRFDPKLREESRDQLKVKPGEIALLFAGSGWERKGLRFAIAAMTLCNNRKMRLLVAGRGNQRSYKSKHVQFLGEVPDPVRIYSAADIFVLPTIYDPFSNACLEALACGLPVITTRSNGFSEIIEHEVNGSTVDFANNVAGLRDAIQFWSQAARRVAARSTNRQRAAQLDISVNVARTLEILVQAAASAVSTSGKI
jgi:UDP-glucose:(heptosyl)LPS alpha-1,3-glucosyltransferase